MGGLLRHLTAGGGGQGLVPRAQGFGIWISRHKGLGLNLVLGFERWGKGHGSETLEQVRRA